MNDFSAQCKPMASKDIFRHRLLRKLIPCELFLKGSEEPGGLQSMELQELNVI